MAEMQNKAHFVEWNNSSMLLESSCSEVENQKDEVHLPRERFSFSEIWTVQPRLDSQTEAAQSRSRKMEILSR